MEETLVKQMELNISTLVEENVFEGKRTYIFGYTNIAEQMIDSLKKYNINVYGIIDNDKRKCGNKLKDVAVYNPRDVLIPVNNDFLIIIASAIHYDEILSQLIELGYKENVCKIIGSNYVQTRYELTVQEFETAIESVCRGRDIYKKIVDDVENSYMFIHPTKSIGNVYVGELFLTEYVKKKNISNYYVVTLDTGGAIVIPRLFGEKKIVSICKNDMDDLVRYSSFVDMNEGRIKIFNNNYIPHTVLRTNIMNFKNINFSDTFYYGVLGLDGEVKLKHPTYTYHNPKNEKLVDDLFDKFDLIKEKTVVFFPDAKTVGELSETFWKKLIIQIKEAGYDVCVNTDREEIYCDIAKVINCNLLYIREFVEKAGAIVSLRSGICDLLSMVECKKIFLYPDRIRGYGSLFNYFSTVKMGLCDDAYEIVFKEDEDGDALIGKITGLI